MSETLFTRQPTVGSLTTRQPTFSSPITRQPTFSSPITRQPTAGSLAAYWQFDSLFKNVTIGVIVLNLENKIFYSNRYAEALFGYSKDEFTGIAVELLIHPNFRAQFEAYQQHYYHPRQAPDMGKLMNCRALRKDGTQFPGVFCLNHYELELKDLLVEFLPDITIRRKEEPLLL